MWAETPNTLLRVPLTCPPVHNQRQSKRRGKLKEFTAPSKQAVRGRVDIPNTQAAKKQIQTPWVMIGLTWGREQKRQKLGTTTTASLCILFCPVMKPLFCLGGIVSHGHTHETVVMSALHCTDTITHTNNHLTTDPQKTRRTKNCRVWREAKRPAATHAIRGKEGEKRPEKHLPLQSTTGI